MADVLWFGPSEDSLTAVRAPDTLTITLQDWDSASTTRTASGKMVRTVIRGGDNNVRKLALSWALLGWSAGKTLADLVKPTYVYCKYPDPQTGAMRTGQFYVGDRSFETRRYRDGTIVWGKISFNLTEV